jgi:hypothetical protein
MLKNQVSAMNAKPLCFRLSICDDRMVKRITKIILLLIITHCYGQLYAEGLKRIKYNDPQLIVDLGSGLWAWPIPMDFDEDGDNDLLVVCHDKPSHCTYFFENPDGNVKMPVFLPPVKVGKSYGFVQASYVDGRVRLLNTNKELINYKQNEFSKTVDIYPTALPYDTASLTIPRKIRANQWKYLDYNGDQLLDLIIAIEDLTDYGWDNAFNSNGQWINGPLHGYIYYICNTGTNRDPVYAKPIQLQAGGRNIDLYGRPSPNFSDFDGDGDLDIICGEFMDGFTYFQNTGSRPNPVYTDGRRLTYNGEPLQMYLQMIIPVAFDWDNDGDMDLIVGDEDGRVAWLENTGKIIDSMPQFLPPRYFRQKADEVKVNALVTPFSVDWDNDGDEDLICGNTAGNLLFIENLDNGNPPKWGEPEMLAVNDVPVRILAGENGSIQGPCEAKWGYTTPTVADWDGDGLLDIVVNSIWGKIVWYKNVGKLSKPKLAPSQPVLILWDKKPQKPEWNWWNPDGTELVTQWRTTPYVIDLNQDGLNDLVMLDHEGYLAFFERVRKDNQLYVLPGKRLFFLKGKENTELFRPNTHVAGKSGRRQFCFADWDRDGKLDILMDSININFFKNISSKDSNFIFEDQGSVDHLVLAGHSTKPTIVDWNKNNIPDLLVGAEDGFLYYLKNPYEKNP